MPKNILIADDDPVMLKLYSRIFSGKDYSITTAENVTTASALIMANNYDLLVTDLMFPDGLGTELIRLFSKKSSAAKSLLVSGSLPAAVQPDLSGATKCFGKPLEIVSFIDSVEKVLK